MNGTESLGLEDADEKQPRATKAQKRRVRLSLRYNCFLNGDQAFIIFERALHLSHIG